ncbi:MAG: sulfotransferase domain-containing protein [Candidatus Nanopelagicales bacterium]
MTASLGALGAQVERASHRPLGPGSIVWLVSYPKSGNTWVRAIISGLLSSEPAFSVNHLGGGLQPFHVGGAMPTLGLDPRWLDRAELAQLRTTLINNSQTGTGSPVVPIFRKTHEVYSGGDPVREPFPRRATRAVILIVRDPREIVGSFADFFAISTAEAVAAVTHGPPAGPASPALRRTEQRWGSWSEHADSWLAADLPFPVHAVRYEDLHHDAQGVLSPVLAAVGLEFGEAALEQAVGRARFDRLVGDEARSGFRETSARSARFFRSGQTQRWRTELAAELVSAIEDEHARMMGILGYRLSADLCRQRVSNPETRLLPEVAGGDERHTH